MAPNKPDRGQRKKSADDDMSEAVDGIILHVMEALTDDRVLKLLKKALYPQPLIEKMYLMSASIDALTKQISEKDTRIRELEKKVCTLEELADKNEQYTQRSNLMFRGFKETGKGEDTDAKIMALVNNDMKLAPPLTLVDIARSHRLGKTREGAGNRLIIVRFNSDRVRDSVHRARVNLKVYNQQHRNAPVFVNDDLTARRSKLAFDCRQMKKENRITDTWTYNGKILIKDLNNQIAEVSCSEDLRHY